ncbi:hypothetical protein QJQ45_008851 [Haematococcus lacustris]|nr:hypothetical protein QJQ45_008851 [Haematococcus lacustris]
MQVNQKGTLYTVMFSSVDDLDPRPAKQQEDSCRGRGGSRSLYRHPVMSKVYGGYTIAPLKEFKLEDSPEAIIICIVKVDLGGACGEHSWFRPFVDLMGWREAFLEQMLMSVVLVRDEVEQGRFAVQPFQLITRLPASKASPPTTTSTSLAPAPGSSRFYATSQHTASGARPSTLATAAKAMGSGALQGEGGATGGHRGLRLELPKERGGMLAKLSEADVMVSPAASQATRVTNSDDGDNPLPAPTPALLDTGNMKQLATLESRFWGEIHAPGTDAPFVVRGPTYLKDKKKIPAGLTQFVFAAMDLIEVPHVVQHVARFLPSIRDSGLPFAIIINLIIPGNPLLGVVATFATEQHPNQILVNPPSRPMEEEHDWQPFDFVLHKFLHGSTEQRNSMLKLIPHIAAGSWPIKQAVGTTPVILGKALKTTYHVTPQYIEIDIDISANKVASYVTGLVRGATKSLVIDMGFVLEGTTPWEVPEALLGAMRLNHLDLAFAKKLFEGSCTPLVVLSRLTSRPMASIQLNNQSACCASALQIDVTTEIPLRPPTYLAFPSTLTTSDSCSDEDQAQRLSSAYPDPAAPPRTTAGRPRHAGHVADQDGNDASNTAAPESIAPAASLRQDATESSKNQVGEADLAAQSVPGRRHVAQASGSSLDSEVQKTLRRASAQSASSHRGGQSQSAGGATHGAVPASKFEKVVSAKDADAGGDIGFTPRPGGRLVGAFNAASAQAVLAAGDSDVATSHAVSHGDHSSVPTLLPGLSAEGSGGPSSRRRLARTVSSRAVDPSVGATTTFGLRHRATHSRNASTYSNNLEAGNSLGEMGSPEGHGYAQAAQLAASMPFGPGSMHARAGSMPLGKLSHVKELPANGLGYKRLRDKPPKAQQQQQPAVA